MANTFGADILIQAADPMEAANFYVKELGFELRMRKQIWPASTEKTSTFLLSGALLLDLFWKLR
ncbi:MAG: hypothetical protein WCA20_26925 [Candidatus Sulfotelmatobacter sp.]